MAPMAGITNLPFRLMVKKLGAAMVTTEMISAMGLIRGQKKTLNYLKTHPDEKPLAIQIFGSKSEAMARAAEMVVEAGANIVDINMGCPVKKVIKTGAGGALLRTPQKVKEIVSTVRKACPAPLTVKIRAGWAADEPVAVETARIIEDCGADAITVHPRFVKQGFSGNADWTIIAEVKEQLKIPVIGNGDVFKPSYALQMKRQTGCDGVMIGRGAIGNPWIFPQVLALIIGDKISSPDISERFEVMTKYLRSSVRCFGEERACRIMRSHLGWFVKGLRYSSRFRQSIKQIATEEEALLLIKEYRNFLEPISKTI